eukprot:TRINITY_DN2352_c0_g3_i4.p1 TRINITY_DN2352_c0_g3~~TRINITY_DN2352_c0_g3_i4.p1  ORF type:complete len:679 (-),score=75.33 TRINITY_DN2352_c0_g3_i4:75-2111(-)
MAQAMLFQAVFRHPEPVFRGAGVAVPVFSLRSARGMGIGEFRDLHALVDLAQASAHSLIQLLPINDTSSSLTWRDSYPYSALSVFALHPLYLHLPALTTDEVILAEMQDTATTLNALAQVDYEKVLLAKVTYLRRIFASKAGQATLQTPTFQQWRQRTHWLAAYTAFLHCRDEYGTANYSEWPSYHQLGEPEVVQAINRSAPEHADFVAYVQFHLHRQLSAAVEYGRHHLVRFKGDLPIGVDPHSVDCWVSPHLFHLDMQTGAPPDQFSRDGQNWGFPTYNWEAMAADQYAWWTARLQAMALYFQVYRIDHILGFFRIWEIPRQFKSGLLGHFTPAHPLRKEELLERGVWDIDRLVLPFIPAADLYHAFMEAHTVELLHAHCIQEAFGGNAFTLRASLRTDRLIEAFFAENAIAGEFGRDGETVKQLLLEWASDVVLVPVADAFAPRINLQHTRSFQQLPAHAQSALQELYVDYFFHRQEGLWKEQALRRLPALQAATNMQICGEDLGMIPQSVAGVLQDLAILGLRVQRMPPDPTTQFGNPAHYPALAVCTPSSHDCSTLRGWWQEDRALTQRYFTEILGEMGEVPVDAPWWALHKSLQQHYEAACMWVIVPLQDFFGIFDDLRVADPASEQINHPENPEHYWRYRMHISLDELLEHPTFTDTVRGLVTSSARWPSF